MEIWPGLELLRADGLLPAGPSASPVTVDDPAVAVVDTASGRCCSMRCESNQRGQVAS